MKASLQWEVTEFFLSVLLGPTTKFHDCGRKCCWGQWGLLSRGSCTLTQKESGFPLLKADSQQWGDELQCHTQKTRIKALLAWLTVSLPSWVSSRTFGCEDTCVTRKHQLRVQAITPRKAELCVGSRIDPAGHCREQLPPSLGWGTHRAPHGDQTHHSQFCLYLAHQPPKSCWLRCSACASSNLPSGQGWDFTSEHVQSSGC